MPPIRARNGPRRAATAGEGNYPPHLANGPVFPVRKKLRGPGACRVIVGQKKSGALAPFMGEDATTACSAVQ